MNLTKHYRLSLPLVSGTCFRSARKEAKLVPSALLWKVFLFFHLFSYSILSQRWLPAVLWYLLLPCLLQRYAQELDTVQLVFSVVKSAAASIWFEASNVRTIHLHTFMLQQQPIFGSLAISASLLALLHVLLGLWVLLLSQTLSLLLSVIFAIVWLAVMLSTQILTVAFLQKRLSLSVWKLSRCFPMSWLRVSVPKMAIFNGF